MGESIFPSSRDGSFLAIGAHAIGEPDSLSRRPEAEESGAAIPPRIVSQQRRYRYRQRGRLLQKFRGSISNICANGCSECTTRTIGASLEAPASSSGLVSTRSHDVVARQSNCGQSRSYDWCHVTRTFQYRDQQFRGNLSSSIRVRFIHVEFMTARDAPIMLVYSQGSSGRLMKS